jgi:hypothetical protein
MKVKTIATVTVSTLILAFASISSAQVSDKKNYSAASCIVDGGSSYSQDYVFRRFGALENLSTTLFLSAICPIFRDGNSKTVITAWIEAWDRHPSENVECNLVRVDSNGNATTIGEATSIVFEEKFDFELGNTDDEGDDEGTMHINCMIPTSEDKNSSIRRYSVE